MKSTPQATNSALPAAISRARCQELHPSNGLHVIEGLSGSVTVGIVRAFPEPHVAVAINDGKPLGMTPRQTEALADGVRRVLEDPETASSVQMMNADGSLQMLPEMHRQQLHLVFRTGESERAVFGWEGAQALHQHLGASAQSAYIQSI